MSLSNFMKIIQQIQLMHKNYKCKINLLSHAYMNSQDYMHCFTTSTSHKHPLRKFYHFNQERSHLQTNYVGIETRWLLRNTPVLACYEILLYSLVTKYYCTRLLRNATVLLCYENTSLYNLCKHYILIIAIQS